MRSSPSWRRATTIPGAMSGRPRAKTSCAKSTPPDARSPPAPVTVTLFQIHHTSLPDANVGRLRSEGHGDRLTVKEIGLDDVRQLGEDEIIMGGRACRFRHLSSDANVERAGPTRVKAFILTA